jgi:hypothetical protein
VIGRNPFKRSVDVPSEVVVAAQLGRGERILAGAGTADGSWLLGTRDAFYVVPLSGGSTSASPAPGAAPGRPRGTRIPWESIERADWDRDGESLVVAEVGEFGRVQPRHLFRMPEPGLLLDLVRERVTASVVLQRRVLTRGKRGLLVIGRRAPAGGGEVQWAYQFDPGVDPEDPDVMAAAEAGLRAAQDELGL